MNVGWSDPKTEVKPDWGFMEKASKSIETSWETDQIFTTPGQAHDFAGPKYAPKQYEAKVHELSTEQLIAISSQRSKGFQTLEVNPRLLQPDQNLCQLPLDELIETVGSSSPLDPLQTIRNYFKTIELPVVGNFFKFEILEPKYELNDATIYQNNKVATSGGLTLHYQDYCFLNLQDTNGKSIKLKHGDVVRSYFDNVIITFPATGPRFRITIGFNSDYIGKDYRAETLYIGDTPQVQSNQNYLKPTPFCISNTNANDTNFLVLDGATGSVAVIRNYVRVVSPQIVSNVYWITHASVAIQTTRLSGSTDAVMDSRWGIDIKDSLGNRIRRLHQEEFFIVGTANPARNEFNIHFSQPLRAQLIGNIQLHVYLEVDNAADTYRAQVKFALNGYGTSPLQFIATNSIPVASTFRLETPSYEIDTFFRTTGV